MKIVYFVNGTTLYSENENPTEIPDDVLPDDLDMIQIVNYGDNIKTLTLPDTLPPNLRQIDLINVGLLHLPTLPPTLKTLDISDNPKLDPNSIYLPDGLSTFICTNNNWTHLPILPRSLRDLACRGNKLEKMPRIPYYCVIDMRLKGFKGLNDNRVTLKIYNDIARHYGLVERTLETFPTEDEYYAVLDLDAGKEVVRATDLGMIFLDLGLSPLVVAEIAAWDRNRKTDLPTISAFDAAQLNGLMESLNTSRRRKKSLQRPFKLSSKGQSSKKT